MEDTLRDVRNIVSDDCDVLILVLMEDTLRVDIPLSGKNGTAVLILVLMEDTLREQRLVSLCLSSFDVCLPL